MFADKMRPIHPGEILREDFLVPLKMSPAAFAKLLALPVAVVSEIVDEQRALSVEVAQRISLRFGGEADFWLRLQQSYDDKIAQRAGAGAAGTAGAAGARR